MQLWLVVMWHPWAVMVWQPCTKCLTGRTQVDAGRPLVITLNVANIKTATPDKISTDDGCCFLSRHRLLLFVDEADAFLRKRSTVSLHILLSETLAGCVTTYFCIVFSSPRLGCNYTMWNLHSFFFFFAGEDQWRPQSHFECLLVSHWRTEQKVNIYFLQNNLGSNINLKCCSLHFILPYLYQLGYLPTHFYDFWGFFSAGSCWCWPVTNQSSLTGP